MRFFKIDQGHLAQNVYFNLKKICYAILLIYILIGIIKTSREIEDKGKHLLNRLN